MFTGHRNFAIFIGMIAVLTLSMQTAHGDVIALKTRAVIAGDATAVTLADIATLQGSAAVALADVVVKELAAGESDVTLTVSDIRRSLSAAGAHWGRVNINGNDVLVERQSATTRSTTLAAMQAVAIDQEEEQERTDSAPQHHHRRTFAAAELQQHGGLAGEIADLFCTQLKVSSSGLRLSFAERDLEAVEQQSTERMRYEIEPVTSLNSDRVRVTIRCWEDKRVVDRETISIWPSVLTNVTLLKDDVRRNSTLTVGDLTREVRWMTPLEAQQIVDPDQVAGKIVNRSLDAGDMLLEQYLEKPVLVNRGDLVTVRCMVGGVVLTIQAEAREDGVLDQVIECRKIGERQVFLATVAGPNEAVVDMGSQ